MGPSEGRCLQLLGGIVGSEWLGTAISAKDVAFAPPATALQVYMGNSGCAAAVVCLPINRTYQNHGYGAVVDLIVIPWPYVIANYVKKPGDRWR